MEKRNNMVYCIECVYKRWEHQEVNSGLINQIAKAAHKDQVTVIADAEYNDALKTYSYPANVVFKNFDFGILSINDGDCIVMTSEYEECLIRLFRQEKLQQGDVVYFFLINKSWLDAMRYIGLLYYDVIFFGVIHGNLQKMYPQSMCFENNMEYTMQTAVNSAVFLKNVHIITYSPHAKSKLKPYINEGIWNRMHFINLPVNCNELVSNIEDDKKVRIGVFGACVNDNAIRIIKQVISNTKSTDLEIIVLSRYILKDKIDDQRVQIYSKTLGFCMEEIRALLLKCNWILLPYDQSKYQVCASGVLADAIRYEVPVLALNSPYIVYYHSQEPIGYIVETEEKLVKKIVELSDGKLDDDREYFVSNMHHIKEKMEQENYEKLTQIMYEKEKKVYSLEELEKALCYIRNNENGLLGRTDQNQYKENMYKYLKKVNSLSQNIVAINRLFIAVQNNQMIGKYLISQGYYRVVIYGLGYLGQRLCQELKRDAVQILCGIDRRGQAATDLIEVVTLEEFHVEPDLIINTVLYDSMEIEESLHGYVNCKIIAIEDLLNEMG